MKCEFFIKHSHPVKNNTNRILRNSILLLILLTVPFSLQAQMFSIDDGRDRLDIPQTAVYLGYEPAKFEYQGSGIDRFSFDGPLIRFRLESSGLNLFLATGGKITGIDDISYFDAGVKAGYSLTLLRKQKIVVQVPLQLTSNITSVVTDNVFATTTQFKQGGLVIGAGADIRFRPSEKFRVHLSMVPSYGFSFATGGTFGGSLSELEGQGRVFLDNLFGNIGLSLGYDYHYKGYDIEQNEYDYDFRSSSILVGITF